MIRRGFEHLMTQGRRGTPFASAHVWAAALSTILMACLVTDTIDFAVVAPNLREDPSSPTVARLVAADPGQCPDDGSPRESFRVAVQVSDPLSRQALEARVVINRFDDGSSSGIPDEPPIEAPADGSFGQWDHCIPLTELDAPCNRIELYVSHGLRGTRLGQRPEPITEGDLAVQTWWVARIPEDPQEQGDPFVECLKYTQPPIEQDGGV